MRPHPFLFILFWAFPITGFTQFPNVEFFPTELPNPVSVSDPPENVEFLGGGAFKEGVAADEASDETQETEDEDYVELNSIQDFWNLYEVSDSFRERYSDGTP